MGHFSLFLILIIYWLPWVSVAGPSLESMCLVSREHPSHHVTEAGGEPLVMARTRDKRREGPRAVPHDPAPRTQHGALCSCFCRLFSARKRHRELRGQVGQEAVLWLQG